MVGQTRNSELELHLSLIAGCLPIGQESEALAKDCLWRLWGHCHIEQIRETFSRNKKMYLILIKDGLEQDRLPDLLQLSDFVIAAQEDKSLDGKMGLGG